MGTVLNSNTVYRKPNHTRALHPQTTHPCTLHYQTPHHQTLRYRQRDNHPLSHHERPTGQLKCTDHPFHTRLYTCCRFNHLADRNSILALTVSLITAMVLIPMGENTKTAAEVFKTVVHNERSWLFVLVLLSMAGVAGMMHTYHTSMKEALQYRRTKDEEFMLLVREAVAEGNVLRAKYIEEQMVYLDKWSTIVEENNKWRGLQTAAMEKVAAQLQRLVDAQLLKQTAADPCEEDIGSDLYRGLLPGHPTIP